MPARQSPDKGRSRSKGRPKSSTPAKKKQQSKSPGRSVAKPKKKPVSKTPTPSRSRSTSRGRKVSTAPAAASSGRRRSRSRSKKPATPQTAVRRPLVVATVTTSPPKQLANLRPRGQGGFVSLPPRPRSRNQSSSRVATAVYNNFVVQKLRRFFNRPIVPRIKRNVRIHWKQYLTAILVIIAAIFVYKFYSQIVINLRQINKSVSEYVQYQYETKRKIFG